MIKPVTPTVLTKGVFAASTKKEFSGYTTDFKNFYRRNPKRFMTRWEVLAWVVSEESRGWVVRPSTQHAWAPPQSWYYVEDDGVLLSYYQRARLLPDLSGIDEATLCGFEVEIVATEAGIPTDARRPE
jgi:hypothetical protein